MYVRAVLDLFHPYRGLFQITFTNMRASIVRIVFGVII